ncbi:MAG: DUF45 domain-containing protein, partial [Chloroflexota bacterium]|nr:DUF45 domain-containing protein [Chloroflexota bacterium]
MIRRNRPSTLRQAQGSAGSGHRRQLSIVAKDSASLGGQTISYTIKRSPRARYIRLEVRPETGLTIVIPRSCQVDQVPELLKRKSRWILSKLAKF